MKNTKSCINKSTSFLLHPCFEPHTHTGTNLDEVMEIPVLHRFSMDTSEPLDVDPSVIPMTNFTKENLTEENFPTMFHANDLDGGFYTMSKNWTPSSAYEEVASFARTKKRNFRLGTALELCVYKLRNLPCPEHFVACAQMWKDYVLFWSTFAWGTMFHLYLVSKEQFFTPSRKVFIVEAVKKNA